MKHKVGDTVKILNKSTTWDDGSEYYWPQEATKYFNKSGTIIRTDDSDKSCYVQFSDSDATGYWFPISVFRDDLEVLLACEDVRETVTISRKLYNLIMDKKPISITSYE
jgi:hypothetical protein